MYTARNEYIYNNNNNNNNNIIIIIIIITIKNISKAPIEQISHKAPE